VFTPTRRLDARFVPLVTNRRDSSIEAQTSSHQTLHLA